VYLAWTSRVKTEVRQHGAYYLEEINTAAILYVLIWTPNLIETFRTIFPDDFKYEGNRALIFSEDESVLVDSLAIYVAAALTFQRDKRLRTSGA
jgi:hypothetical protein